MRVITGTARGRRLREPVGSAIRPTTDQVKEAMFDLCQFRVPGSRVLDLFGGTGQLGIEAASRGAAAVDIVERGRTALQLIRENVKLTGLQNIRVHAADAISFLQGCGQYDLILIDPPYDSALAETALQSVKSFDILSDGGIIICETRAEKSLSDPGQAYRKLREYRYGKVKLTTIAKETEP